MRGRDQCLESLGKSVTEGTCKESEGARESGRESMEPKNERKRDGEMTIRKWDRSRGRMKKKRKRNK